MHYIVNGSVFTVGSLATSKRIVITLACNFVCLFCLGGFHLHLLVFPNSLVCQIRFLVHLFIICKWLLQKDFSIISKFVCCNCYMKKNEAFTLISFAVLRWMFISSTAIWVTSSDPCSVASRAIIQLTSSKCEWSRIWTI